MHKTIKILMDFLVGFIFLNYCIFILIINCFKIRHYDIIILQNERVGFGNIFTSIDLSRKIFQKKKILFILFYEEQRFHNKYLYELLNEKKIILRSSIFFGNFKKVFGEIDQFGRKKIKKNIFQNMIISFVKYIKRKKTKIFSINELYEFSLQKVKLNKIKVLQRSNQWFNVYFKLVKQKKLRLNNNDLNVQEFLFKKKKKTVCIYFREKSFSNTFDENDKFYLELINLLFKNNLNLFLTGEYKRFMTQYPKIKKFVLTPNEIIFSKKSEKLINLLMQLTSDFYIGPSGGGAWFAMYKKSAIIFGQEECFDRPNVKSFKYNLYYNNKLIDRESRFYKTLKKKMIIDDNMGDIHYLKKNNIIVNQINNNKIFNEVVKSFK